MTFDPAKICLKRSKEVFNLILCTSAKSFCTNIAKLNLFSVMDARLENNDIYLFDRFQNINKSRCRLLA